MKNFTQKFIGILALVFTISFTVNSQEIGDVYEGGYIFQINEDGTGLVADLQDLDQMNWDSAMNLAEASILWWIQRLVLTKYRRIRVNV